LTLPPVKLILPRDSKASGWLPVAVKVPPPIAIPLKTNTAIPLDITPVNSTLLLESSN
jgi:hypothetical protein